MDCGQNQKHLGADCMRRVGLVDQVGLVNRDEFFIAITWKILSWARFKIQAGKKCTITFSKCLLLMFQRFFINLVL